MVRSECAPYGQNMKGATRSLCAEDSGNKVALLITASSVDVYCMFSSHAFQPKVTPRNVKREIEFAQHAFQLELSLLRPIHNRY